MSSRAIFDSKSRPADDHIAVKEITDHDKLGYNRVTKSTSIVEKQNKLQSFNVPASVHSNPRGGVPLADQYLDAMLMNDVWGALCLRIIFQKQQEQHALKRPNPVSTKLRRNPSTGPRSHPTLPCKTLSRGLTKSETCPSTSAINSNVAYQDKSTSSSASSDSGFESYPSTPNSSETNLWVRSTRSHPSKYLDTTMPMDASTSTAGRHCLSCKTTDTTCWRHAFGGVVCNSCGLR